MSFLWKAAIGRQSFSGRCSFQKNSKLPGTRILYISEFLCRWSEVSSVTWPRRLYTYPIWEGWICLFCNIHDIIRARHINVVVIYYWHAFLTYFCIFLLCVTTQMTTHGFCWVISLCVNNIRSIWDNIENWGRIKKGIIVMVLVTDMPLDSLAQSMAWGGLTWPGPRPGVNFNLYQTKGYHLTRLDDSRW